MKKILIIISIILLLICSYISFNTSSALAAEESGYKIQVAIPGGPTAGTSVGLADYIQYIYIFGLSLIGITALGVLIYGGLLYMLSDTGGSKEDAKKYIWAAISGLILGLAAFLILNTINPDLTSLTPPKLDDLSELKAPVPPTDQATDDEDTDDEDTDEGTREAGQGCDIPEDCASGICGVQFLCE